MIHGYEAEFYTSDIVNDFIVNLDSVPETVFLNLGVKFNAAKQYYVCLELNFRPRYLVVCP